MKYIVMKKYSVLLVLICVLTAAPAWAVLQNSAVALGVVADANHDVISTDLIVWSHWLGEHSADDVGVKVRIQSRNSACTDHGTQFNRFSELNAEILGDEASVEILWTNGGIPGGPTEFCDDPVGATVEYEVCATLVRFTNNGGEVERGPETCTGPFAG